MIRRSLVILLAAFLLPVAAEAQARLLLGGGLTRPTGDFSNSLESGYHGRVGLQIGVPVFPISLRGEGEVHTLAEMPGDDNTSIINGALSAVLSLGGIGLTPYVLAGFGQYRVADSGDDAPVSNRGYHGGFGAALGALGAGAFFEIRLVNVTGLGQTTRYIPVTVGLRF